MIRTTLWHALIDHSINLMFNGITKAFARHKTIKSGTYSLVMTHWLSATDVLGDFEYRISFAGAVGINVIEYDTIKVTVVQGYYRQLLRSRDISNLRAHLGDANDDWHSDDGFYYVETMRNMDNTTYAGWAFEMSAIDVLE